MDQDLDDVKLALKKILVQGLRETFERLEELLDKKSSKFDDLISIKAKYSCYQDTFYKGGLSFINKDKLLINVQNELLFYINGLKEVDTIFENWFVINSNRGLEDESDEKLKLKLLLGENRVDEVIGILSNRINSASSKEFELWVILKQRWTQVKRDQLNHLKPEEEISIEKIAIHIALIHLINALNLQ